jgi:transcriptional regulator with XRE-family HTH domain
MLSPIKLRISQKLKDKRYRDKFFRGQAQDEIACALKAARKKRGLTQPELEELSGMKQSAISRIEQSSYSRWNFTTLLRLAEALDLRVRVLFDCAEDVIHEYERRERAQIRTTASEVQRSAEFMPGSVSPDADLNKPSTQAFVPAPPMKVQHFA